VVRPLRVGVQLPEIERRVPWTEYAAMARAAEEVGLDSLWLGDHLLYRLRDGRERGPWDTFTLLAALAAVTDRVQIGPLVACTAWHPPGILARKAAALHEISGGRFVLGLGAGWNEAEFRAFGLPFDHRASRFEEAFEIIRRLIAGERVTFHGSFYGVDDAVLLPRPARRIPLMLGSSGARMLAIALPHVDVWNTWYSWYGNSSEGFASRRVEIDAACRNAGRKPGEVRYSACVLVAAGGASERSHEVPAVAIEKLAAHLRALEAAGADEAILVLDPITERSTRTVADAIVDLK
jgi:alkanesulfonate monooxygenase SsuD/methylene tetrahydromethanopterin reductase-like flavin-dependent oxidoreductase (luciferase family)